MTSYSFGDLLEAVVDVAPDRPALTAHTERGTSTRTFAELDERINRLANALAARGIGRGDHVAIYSLNGVEWVEAMFALYKLGAAAVNVNFRYVEAELEYLLLNADCVGVLYQAQYGPRLAAIADHLESIKVWVEIEDGNATTSIPGVQPEHYEALIEEGSPERNFDPRNGDELYLLYTGGTTGMPKGVMWRQEDVFFALGGGIDPFTKEPVPSPTHHADNVAASVALGGGGVRLFPIAPLMHGAGQFGVMNALLQGNAVTLIDKFDAARVWEIVETDGVNVLNITGDAMARPLADALEASDVDTSGLFTISSTAAIFSPPVKEQFLNLLPNVMILDAIGSTESGMNGIRLVTKEQKPQEGVTRVDAAKDAVVIDEDYQPVEPGSGVVGRLARTGNIPIGYYNDPVKTAETFPVVNGVRYSIPGDHARVEADGTITLLGRGSVSINSGGEKIFPEEVEGALKAHPEVFDALVVGVPDERWGQRVVAVVQARPGATPTQEGLAEHSRTLVAGYKIPRQVILVPEIRRAASGKPDYPWAMEYAKSLTAEDTSPNITGN